MPKALEPIPITKPVFGQRERELMCAPLDTGWVVQGPYVRRFEEMFAGFTGASHALATTSCTTALHLILAALGIGPGDEVIVPSFTFVASANAVEYAGARPVFCDIDLATFNLDPEAARRAITPRTRAIMPVSLFGLCADLPVIADLAKAHGLRVIEDAACALGARLGASHAGTLATAGAFSFHPRKAITTGEGGMVTTNDPALAELVGKLRNHGAEATDLERHQREGGSLLPAFNLLGFNYRMTDIQGALGVAQMERAGEILAARRAAARVYDGLLAGLETVAPPLEPAGFTHAYQSYVVLYTAGERPSLERLEELNRARNRLMTAMERQGVTVRQGTHAVHTLGYYAAKYGLKPQDFPNSLMADRLSITLPLFAGISAEEQERVAEFLRRPERWLACAA